MAFTDRLTFLLDLNADGAIRGFNEVGRTANRELGRTEDKLGEAFVGAAGEELDEAIKSQEMEDLVFITNVVKCRPPMNMTPKSDQMTTCANLYLYPEIQQINPLVIVLLGVIAQSEFAHLWKKDRGRFHHVSLPLSVDRQWKGIIVPTVHPSFVRRRKDVGDNKPLIKLREDLALAKGFVV